MKLKIAIVGAGSQSFGPGTIRDILISDRLAGEAELELCLMDILPENLPTHEAYVQFVADKLDRRVTASATTDLAEAVTDADFVITAIEVDRYKYWAQDFHIPRRYGFEQIFGENGGPGSLFHALRNIGPMVDIARAMEQRCPDAWLINYTNPESKLCDALNRLTDTKVVGLCHEVFGGLERLAEIFEVKKEDIDAAACGFNHFTFFQTIKDRRSGEDLYPLLKEKDKNGNWLGHWDDIAMARILYRTYGLFPASTTNHFGEYVDWAKEFFATSPMQYFYDPGEGEFWETGEKPVFVYSQTSNPTGGKMLGPPPRYAWDTGGDPLPPLEEQELKSSHELAIPIMEAVTFKETRELDAVVMPNRGAIPGLPDESTVEMPATVDGNGIHTHRMAPLPVPITNIIQTHVAIQKLLAEAFAEQSKQKLLQAALLDPTVDSYHRAVAMINEMIRLQHDVLPPLR